MPADRQRSQGRNPRTPYTCHRRRRSPLVVQPDSSQLRMENFFSVRNTVRRPPSNKGIDALPETVLRVILSMLSAADLFLRANRVCKQWRNIISEEGFCRWKKRYFCYHHQEKTGQQKVLSILKENHMTPADNNNLCLLHMAKYMSQTFHCMPMVLEREREERILKCIRLHRLYGQARACMSKNMMQREEDPWSCLALMLVLADGVDELWQLVVRLRCPLTPEQLSEFLWCSATLLRAMADARVKISNRLHYNIYYVLHLMENTISPTNISSARENDPLMTPEQEQILSHEPESDHVVKIMAYAGTGKTTTLNWYARQWKGLKFLYAVFNKEVQKNAKRIFPGNVICNTFHSLAHTAVGHRYKQKTWHKSSLNLFSVFKVLPDGERSIVWAKVVAKTISNFWGSTDPHIDTQHVPEWYKSTSGHMQRPNKREREMFVANAKRIWEKMKEVEPTSEIAYHMYPDGYLKLWQLECTKMKDYDVIFIDEAQDCTPAIMDILLSQPCAKILVGDPHQQIYSFRGAVNSLNTIQHTHIYYLTQSFRFGPEIAYVSSTILEVGKGVRKMLVGGHQTGSVRGQDVEMWRRFLTGKGGADGKLAILARTNAYVFQEAVRLTDPLTDSRIYIIGGTQTFCLRMMEDICALKNGLISEIKDKFILGFYTRPIDGMVGYAGLKKYAWITEDHELTWKIVMVEKYGNSISEHIRRIRERHLKKPEKADFILSTMHKAKGLEFDTVFIMDDFRELLTSPAQEHGGNQSSFEDDDWNLIYMAVTRARRTLFMNKMIPKILARAGEHFLRTELTALDHLPQCSTKECTNICTCLHMCRLQVTTTDAVKNGGAVCLNCVLSGPKKGHLAFLIQQQE